MSATWTREGVAATIAANAQTVTANGTENGIVMSPGNVVVIGRENFRTAEEAERVAVIAETAEAMAPGRSVRENETVVRGTATAAGWIEARMRAENVSATGIVVDVKSVDLKTLAAAAAVIVDASTGEVKIKEEMM